MTLTLNYSAGMSRSTSLPTFLLAQALILQCHLRRGASSAECLYYPGPEPFFAPLAVPTVERAVRTELLFGEVSPRRTASHDPQYPAKHLPVVASGASFARLLPRQQLSDALPLVIAEKPGSSIGTKGCRHRRFTLAGGVGRLEVISPKTIIIVVGGGVSCPVGRLVGALRRRLVGSTKRRPSQPKLPLLFRTPHRADQPPYLRYGGRDQFRVGTPLEPPPLAAPSSSSATERTTAR